MSDQQSRLDDDSARRAAFRWLLTVLPATDRLACRELVTGPLAADASEMLEGIDMPDLARDVLLERISRRLIADSTLTIMAVQVLRYWHDEDETPTLPELMADIAGEIEKQSPGAPNT